jgi:hypothetical protein
VVSYSQLAVFNPGIEGPFNAGTDQHVALGFSWRSGSVSFRTILETGPQIISVTLQSELDDPPPEAIGVIDVPFQVPPGGFVEIGSIFASRDFEIAPGSYQLRFECCADDSALRSDLRLRFFAKASPVFHLFRIRPDLLPESSSSLIYGLTAFRRVRR